MMGNERLTRNNGKSTVEKHVEKQQSPNNLGLLGLTKLYGPSRPNMQAKGGSYVCQ
jgi:hypothetical protein